MKRKEVKHEESAPNLDGTRDSPGCPFLFGLLKGEPQDDKPSTPLLDFDVEQIIGLEVQPA